MNWALSVLGLGGLAGWLYGLWQRERAKSAQADAVRFAQILNEGAVAYGRLQEVLKLRDDQLKKLEEELDALDTPASVRARIQRLLTPPVAPTKVVPDTTAPYPL